MDWRPKWHTWAAVAGTTAVLTWANSLIWYPYSKLMLGETLYTIGWPCPMVRGYPSGFFRGGVITFDESWIASGYVKNAAVALLIAVVVAAASEAVPRIIRWWENSAS